MFTHRGIISTAGSGFYRSIRTLWYEKISVWGWIGSVPLVIFVDTADSFALGNTIQNNCEKKYEIK